MVITDMVITDMIVTDGGITYEVNSDVVTCDGESVSGYMLCGVVITDTAFSSGHRRRRLADKHTYQKYRGAE